MRQFVQFGAAQVVSLASNFMEYVNITPQRVMSAIANAGSEMIVAAGQNGRLLTGNQAVNTVLGAAATQYVTRYGRTVRRPIRYTQ